MTTGVMTAGAATAGPRAEGADGAHRRRFHVGMALAVLAVVLAGFGQRYFTQLPAGTLDLPPLVHAHAAAFTAWIVLFLAQTALVASHRVRLHRRLGVAGAALAVAIVGLGVAVSLHGARHGWNPAGPPRGPFRSPREFLLVPLWDVAVFGGFVAAALAVRRHRALHGRLMLLATVGGMLWAAITRIPPLRANLPAMLALLACFVAAGPMRDLLARRRPHPVDVWGGLFVLASPLLRGALARTEAWHAVAAWLVP